MSNLAKGRSAKISKARQEEIKKLCSSWTQLHARINELNLEEAQKALYIEAQEHGNSRPRVLKRLVGRIGALQREADYAALGIK